MENQFILILKKSDEGKFRWFQNGKRKQEKEILRKHNSNHVLGLHKGAISEKTWSKIKKNDKIYVTIENETFRISGSVIDKSKKSNYGEIIYPNEIDKKQINYFLFFKKLDSCREPYEILKQKSKLKIFSNEGIFELKQESIPKKTKKVKVNKKLIEKSVGLAEKRWQKTQSYTRNQSNVNQLKKLYNNQCQIEQCNFKLDYEKNGKIKQFSHVHHYNQIAESLIDSLDNMIVLCPNHHAEFDYRVKLIDRDGKTIINRKGKETGETIKFRTGHQIDIKNIESLLGE
jgi:hypothetical protein